MRTLRFPTRWSRRWAGRGFRLAVGPTLRCRRPALCAIAHWDRAIQYFRDLRLTREASAYWIPTFAGMTWEGVSTTPGRGFPFSLCFVHPALALSLRHDIPTDSPTRPDHRHRPRPAPHRLGRDRDRGQPARLHRLRLGGAAGRSAAGQPPPGDP